MVDFIYSKTVWENLEDDTQSQRYTEMERANFVQQFITESLRDNNILDLILSNNENLTGEIEDE